MLAPISTTGRPICSITCSVSAHSASMVYFASGERSLSPCPRLSSATTCRPRDARIWPVFFQENRFWPPPCSISTDGSEPCAADPAPFHSSATSVSPSEPRNRLVVGSS